MNVTEQMVEAAHDVYATAYVDYWRTTEENADVNKAHLASLRAALEAATALSQAEGAQDDSALAHALEAADMIVAEGTSDNPSGYGPPYKGPWFIIDKSSAEPEVNWPGELIEEIHDLAKVSPALTRAKVAAMRKALPTRPREQEGAADDRDAVLAAVLHEFGPDGCAKVLALLPEAKDYVKALREPARPREPQVEAGTGPELLGDRNNNGGFIRDLCFTAFTQAKRPNSEDGGESDWFNDTLPKVNAGIEKIRAMLPTRTREPVLRQCGYCKAWQSKPCGDGCCWSPTDPAFAHPPAASFQAPEGWKLVPIDSTPKMLDRFIDKAMVPEDYGNGLRIDDLRAGYAAMLAAAPAPPEGPVASFQAGAEAMREAAAKAAEADIPYHYVSNDSGEWKDWQPGSPYDRGQLHRAQEIAKTIRSLPIPASSEGR